MFYLKSSLVLALFLFILIKPSFPQIDKNDAIDIIMNELVASEVSNYNVYLYSELSMDSQFNLTPYDQIANPYDSSWVFFIDLMPEYGWGHLCKYVFVHNLNGDYSVITKCIPPLYYWRTW